ncbi:M23 family metallopeptidase [Candidatus Margulisiibacteriota bacterium]
MKKKQKKQPPHKNTLTLMLLPHYSGKPIFTLKMRKWFLYFLLTAWVGIIAIFCFSLFYSSSVTRKLINYSSLVAQNKLQMHQIGNHRKKTAILDAQVRELLERDQQLRALLGLGSFNMDKATARASKKKINYTAEQSLTDLDSLLDQMKMEITVREASLGSLKETIRNYQRRFAHTPSIWPVYGRFGSGYGWRKHPILGVWHMHRGIDFPTWYGAPVKATADGVVERVGWLGGYGKAVIINHLYGIKTLYGHNSRFLVKKGMKVKKGQVIAEAGSTGMSTGPHVHYEIIKRRKAIRPNRYLNLNMFTAAKKRLW